MSRTSLKVIITRALPNTFPISAFDDRCEFEVAPTEEELRQAIRRANVLYSWHIPSNVPEEAPHLRWIHVPSAGTDHLRVLPVWNSGITITSSVGIHTVPMAEHFFAMLLGLTRQIPVVVRNQERHEWAHEWRGSNRIGEIRGQTLGIIGWGKIGEGISHLARAFGMRVIGTRWSVAVPREVPDDTVAHSDPPWIEPEDLAPDIVYPAAHLHDVLAQSDAVLLILPLTDETRHSFGRAEFQSMRRGALFFNLGRGAVVDESALVAALRSGRVAGAGLDVFEEEPLPASSPLWDMVNVIVSPHLGGRGDHTAERTAEFFAVNLSRYLESQPLLNIVNRNQGY